MQRAGVDVRDATAADAGVVAAPARRSGVGRALIRAAEAKARRHGCPRLDLSSGDWRSDAHAFYEALGFERSALAFRRRLPDG